MSEYCALVDLSPNTDEALERVGEQLHAALGELEPLLHRARGTAMAPRRRKPLVAWGFKRPLPRLRALAGEVPAAAVG